MQRLHTVCFITTLTLFFILNMISPDKSFSENENRYLTPKPTFSVENLFNHRYTSDFENYLNDQFVFRDNFVEGKMLCERLLGKVENNSVYFGKDHYLIARQPSYNPALVQKNIDYINQFASTYSNKIDFQMMLVPSPRVILEDKLPYLHDDIDEKAILEEIQATLDPSIHYFDLMPTFLAHNNASLYFKTDHHFNLNGALLAYQAFTGHPHQDIPTIVSDNFLGTLASKAASYHHQPDAILKLSEPSNITVAFDDGTTSNSIYFEENLNKKDKYTYYLNGNHSIVNIKTGHKNKPKLLIVRDSYANIFTTTLLEDYSEITLVDLRYYRLPLSSIIEHYDNLLFLYSSTNFIEDVNFGFLK